MNGGGICDWEGTVGTWEDHLKKCGSVLVACPLVCKKNGEDVVLSRKDVEEHLTRECPNRMSKCEHCGKEDKLVTILEVHSSLCSKKKLACPNLGCNRSMERGRMEGHVQRECEYAVVPCKYSGIGCIVKDARKFIATHEAEDGIHFPLSLSKIVQLGRDVTSLRQEMSQLREVVAAARESSTLLKDETITLNDEIIVMRGEATGLRGDVKMLQDETDSLRSEVNTLMKKVTVFIMLPGFHAKREANEEFVSEPFFTIPSGYKMCLVVHPNGSGDGEGTHVSAYVEVLEVAYNEKLRWPLTATIKVELLNQLADKAKPESKNHKTYLRSISASVNGGWFCPRFISHSDLIHTPANTQYLLDDALYFRLSVQENF